jgi:DNA-binding transcriptional MerR regulator
MKPQQNLLTTGEFAYLGNTSKRTIQYYDKIDLLKPFKINSKGYRLYKTEQIIDLQVILLLKALQIPLEKIKTYLEDKDFREIFQQQKDEIEKKLEFLQYSLKNLSKYYTNLDKNSVLIDPQIKQVDKFEYYYIEKEGPYSAIGDYCIELIDMFSTKPAKIITLTVFTHEGYKPQGANMQIGLLKNNELKINKKYEDLIKIGSMEDFTALTYMHHGGGKTMSLMWQEAYKYMRMNKIAQKSDVPEFEIYWEVSEKEYKNKFELFVPIANKQKPNRFHHPQSQTVLPA